MYMLLAGKLSGAQGRRGAKRVIASKSSNSVAGAGLKMVAEAPRHSRFEMAAEVKGVGCLKERKSVQDRADGRFANEAEGNAGYRRR